MKLLGISHFSVCIYLIVILTGCKSEETLVLEDLDVFKTVNTCIEKNKENMKCITQVDSLFMKIPECSSSISTLKSKFNLSEVQIHTKDSGQTGIAYLFGNRKQRNYRFLLYVNNENFMNEFMSYEQFTECSERVWENENWCLIRINDCTD